MLFVFVLFFIVAISFFIRRLKATEEDFFNYIGIEMEKYTFLKLDRIKFMLYSYLRLRIKKVNFAI